MQPVTAQDLRTLDLSEFANIGQGDEVVVEPIGDKTQDLFEETLDLFELEAEEASVAIPKQLESNDDRFIPKHQDLRKIFLFAEALGGYETLNELVSEHSTSSQLSVRFNDLSQANNFTSREIKQLEEQQKNLSKALKSAKDYLQRHATEEFSRKELAELHHILVNASVRNKQITKVLGIYKITEIEKAVARLYAFQLKIQSVNKNLSGIFLVDSEVLFIPTRDLIECVNIIFSGVGNPYLTDNIDGVMLLAARNLLIQAVSFYSYYGRERIYDLVKKSGNTISTAVISHHIRNEIRDLFKACETDNKLVLKRIMRDAEREFEISVESIQMEAEHNAIAAVKEMLPRATIPKPVAKKSLFKKILSWFNLSTN